MKAKPKAKKKPARKLAKPAKAYALVDENGRIVADACWRRSSGYKSTLPHIGKQYRIARVEIREADDE